MARKTFVVLGSTRELVTQVLLALHAGVQAHCIAVFPPMAKARSARFSRLASEVFEAGFTGSDDDAVCTAIGAWAAQAPGVTLVAADCDGARLINRLRPRLDADLVEGPGVQIAPTPDDAMLECFDDKWRFHQFCRQHGFLVPPALLLRSKRDLDFDSAADELGLPLVVKPTNDQASRGVRVIADGVTWKREVLDKPQYQFAPLMVQRYVGGVDLGLNLLAIRGEVRALAVQRRDPPQSADARIRFIDHAGLHALAHSLCQASGYHGVMNVDCRMEEGSERIFLFESNPRYWRSLSASVWCGLNFVVESLRPPPVLERARVLNSGSADTFYHPVFSPALWPGMFGPLRHRRRLAHWMLRDTDTLGEQLRARVEWYGSKLRTTPRTAPTG